MKKRIVFSNSKTYLPINHTLIVLFLLYYFDLREWVMTLCVIWLILCWIVSIASIHSQELFDINKCGEEKETEKHKTTTKKVIEIIKSLQ